MFYFNVAEADTANHRWTAFGVQFGLQRDFGLAFILHAVLLPTDASVVSGNGYTVMPPDGRVADTIRVSRNDTTKPCLP